MSISISMTITMIRPTRTNTGNFKFRCSYCGFSQPLHVAVGLDAATGQPQFINKLCYPRVQLQPRVKLCPRVSFLERCRSSELRRQLV